LKGQPNVINRLRSQIKIGKQIDEHATAAVQRENFKERGTGEVFRAYSKSILTADYADNTDILKSFSCLRLVCLWYDILATVKLFLLAVLNAKFAFNHHKALYSVEQSFIM